MVAYLRAVFAPLSVEHLTYREFLQLAPETTCLLSCLDTKAQYKGMAAIREAAEIEEQILDSVAPSSAPNEREQAERMGATQRAKVLATVADRIS